MIESPEPPHAHHGSGIKWFDAAITLSVLMVSIASLVIALHTGSTMEQLVHENARLVRASSTPLLSFSTGNAVGDGKARISFNLSNNGSGPARLVWFQLHYQGRTPVNILELVRAAGGSVPLVRSQSRPLVRSIISAGEERTFIGWDKPADAASPDGQAWTKLEAARWNVKVEACYCSLLDECWLSSLNGDVPKQVAQCDAVTHPSFGDIAAH